MDFEKINEEEILNKMHRHISDNTPGSVSEKPSSLPDRFNEDILRALGLLHKVKDPTFLPQDTRFRFFKRIIQRFLRPFTRDQVEFNRIATDILNGLTGNIQQFLYLYQRNFDQIQSILENQSHTLEEIREELTRKIHPVIKGLTKQIETSNTMMEQNRNELAAQLNDGLKLLHERIEDEKKSIYSVLESVRENLQIQITSEKESIHDRVSQTTMNLHQRIDDEKKGIYNIVDLGLRDVKNHSAKLWSERFTPSEIYRLYQEQNNITDDIYFKLEKNFRGTDEYVKERQDYYRNLLSSHHVEMKEKGGYYLDIGCGRGEFLKLLKDNDLPGCGIDINEQMVQKCQEMDLTVYREEAISFLKKLPDSELRGVIALQVIEHLSIKSLFEMLYLIHQKLKSGGILVLETINPESVYALRWFYMDYTHNKPLPAPLVQFFIYMAGFPQAEIILRSPVEGWKQMAHTGDKDVLDQNFNKLNNFLFGYQDYAIKAIK